MRAVAGSASVEPLEPDEQLVARALEGSSDAFECLVARYQAGMHRYAMSLVLDAEVAADMVQDAFVRAYVNLRACRDPQRFRAWLFQTLRNRCLDHLKAAGRRTVPLEDASALPDTADRAEDRMERQRAASAVRRALAALPPAQREAFVMHYVHDVPYDALAETLGVSVSALKMRALRARQALSEALARADVTPSPAVRLMARGPSGIGAPTPKEEA